ncbi:MAG TPA: 2-amino-4-hydroxy-6-hydroxymethyldihydropteridine diphosphokinase [Mariprofundaceae bacterium]|nr:2-amino-4-hydroxy-6-hydroxymethyldihydropteridine diphosphokinase [Mariprofundaceae bacterium]
MSNVLIALGGNLGDVRASFDTACQMLQHNCHIITKSKLYQTPALLAKGAASQSNYLNAIIHVVSTLPPADLLTELHRIEAAHGRERKERWGARTLDLDLIDYEGFTSNDSALMLPHPAMAQRLFVLQPLHDVIPNWIHPVTNLNVQGMICLLQQKGEVLVEGKLW